MDTLGKIDIVIPLGNGSKWHNNELKYCLRSIEKYLKNYRHIYLICDGIIFDIPKFIDTTHVNIIQSELDITTPSKNIWDKIYVACEHIVQFSKDFVLFNDDYFLTKEVDALRIPNYYNNRLLYTTTPYDNWYNDFLENTDELLKTEKRMCLNFDIHYPMIINKQKFLELHTEYNERWREYGDKLLVKSLYGNLQEIKNVYAIEDCKIKDIQSTNYVRAFINNKWMFSTGDKCLTEPVKQLIQEMYPDKSKYEL